MMGTAERLHIKSSGWSSYLCEELYHLWQEQRLCDITLTGSSGEPQYQAHSVVLSAVSPLLRVILKENTFVKIDNMSSEILGPILQFVYKGYMEICIDQLGELLEAADTLQIRELQAICSGFITVGEVNMFEKSMAVTEVKLEKCDIKTEHLDVLEDNTENQFIVHGDQEVVTASSENVDKSSEIEENEKRTDLEETETNLAETLSTEDKLICSEHELTFTHSPPERTPVQPIQCCMCSQKFHTAGGLTEHIQEKHTPGDSSKTQSLPTCKLCHKVYNSMQSLYQHRSKVHKSRPELHKCTLCKRQYKSAYALRAHVNRHVNHNQTLDCQLCHQSFTDKVKWEKHMKLHQQFDQKDLPFPCPSCPRKFDRKKYWNQHMRSHGEKVKCSVCSKVFRTAGSLWKHQVRAHPNQEDDWLLKEAVADPVQQVALQCKNCNRKYQTEAELETHTKRAHPQAEKSFVCTICGKSFGDRKNLYNHEKRMHPEDRDKWVGLSQKKHRTIIDGTMYYWCSQCGQSFKSRNEHRYHERSHVAFHNRPWACQFCDWRFFRKTELQRHYARAHSDVAAQAKLLSDIKEFQKADYECDECGKVFPFINDLRKHKNVHILPGSRPVACPLCDKRFIWKSTLRKHLKTHNKVRVTGKLQEVENSVEEEECTS